MLTPPILKVLSHKHVSIVLELASRFSPSRIIILVLWLFESPKGIRFSEIGSTDFDISRQARNQSLILLAVWLV